MQITQHKRPLTPDKSLARFFFLSFYKSHIFGINVAIIDISLPREKTRLTLDHRR